MNESPLLNEPGINSNNNNIIPYNLLINYKTIEFSIIKQINFIINNNTSNTCNTFNNYNNILLLFKDKIFQNFKNNINNIINNIDDLEKKLISYNNIIYIEIYNLYYNLSINILRNNLNKIKIE